MEKLFNVCGQILDKAFSILIIGFLEGLILIFCIAIWSRLANIGDPHTSGLRITLITLLMIPVTVFFLMGVPSCINIMDKEMHEHPGMSQAVSAGIVGGMIGGSIGGSSGRGSSSRGGRK